MELRAVFCALAVCSVFRGALTCQERDVEVISGVLTDVSNWGGLAGRLNIRIDLIKADCVLDSVPSMCYRRSLVSRYCNKQLSENPSKVAEDIAKEVEQMDHNLQAQQLRKLKFDEGPGTAEEEGDKNNGEIRTTPTEQPLQCQESADSPPLPDTQPAIDTGQRGITAVKADIKQLKDGFKTFKQAAQMQLKEANIPINDLLDVVYSLPPDIKKLHQKFLNEFPDRFVNSNTINAVFRRLGTHEYWDYLNIDILDHIISEFSLPCQEKWNTYKIEQQRFMNQTTVREFCEAEGHKKRVKPPSPFVELISQHKWKSPIYLKEVDDFRKTFSLRYDLRESVVILVSVQGG